MKSNSILWVVMIVVAIIAIGAYFHSSTPSQPDMTVGSAVDCGGSQSSTCLTGNLRLNDGGFQMGSSTACVMVNATSTATPIRFRFLGVSTTSADGFVTWSYGTCV